METVEHDHIETNGIKLHVVRQGPKDGEVIMLLHGFPEFWYGWHKQIPYLAEKGYRVWAPDQRGYNLSDKPSRVDDYAIDELVEDIAGLINVSNNEKVNLVGHDWGGIVAWHVARKHPELIRKLVVINAPHDRAMIDHVRGHPAQLFRVLTCSSFSLEDCWKRDLNPPAGALS
ncbi:MAG: alpha/beta hydrolase [Alkalibacterium sp.]|nr:alpha/beta hydrolase [Alkalibacterium sp.]